MMPAYSSVAASLFPDYVDPSLILYTAFFGLFIMRTVCGWKCCGVRFVYTNYCSIMYFVVSCLCLYAVCRFIAVGFAAHYRPTDIYLHPDANIDEIPWLRWFVWGCPFALVLTIVLCMGQTGRHMEEIFKEKAKWSHDRALQVIAIPAVFGTMMLSSIVPVYHLIASGDHLNWEVESRQANQRYDTCFFVADVYEAWALYQFGMLTLEQVNLNIKNKNRSRRRSTRSTDTVNELMTTHSAVAQLMWLGVFLFIVVCLSQAGYALAMQIHSGGETLDEGMLEQFEIAGLIASGAAIYNVYVVESTFHHHLDSYRPRLKFISVKILVSLAFFQRGIIVMCQTINSWQPTALQGVTRRVPFFGDILNMSTVEMHLFYPALLIYECLASAMLHSWAWAPDETWYDDAEIEGSASEAEGSGVSSDDAGENKPLLLDSKLPPGAIAAGGSSGSGNLPPAAKLAAIGKPAEDAV